MKEKRIKRLIFGLIPIMLAFFSLSVITSTVKTAVADSETYPFRTGLNAFEHAWELTVPEKEDEQDEYSVIYYKPDIATEDDPYFPSLEEDGSLALHIQTNSEVKLSFNLYNGDTKTTYPFLGEPSFIEDPNTDLDPANPVQLTVETGAGGSKITFPANTRGALILPLKDFSGVNLSTIEIFTVHAYKESAGAKVKVGTLGYYEDDTMSSLSVLTTAELLSSWKINCNEDNPEDTEEVKDFRQISSAYKKGVNAFAYGKNVALGSVSAGAPWSNVYYHPDNGAFDASSKGYFALRIQAKEDMGIYFSLHDENKVQIYYNMELKDGEKYPVYFEDVNGTRSALTVGESTQHAEIPAGSDGMLIIPASSFKDSVIVEENGVSVEKKLDWTKITLFILNINGAQYPSTNANVGELKYYENDFADGESFTTINSIADSEKIGEREDTDILTPIHYIDPINGEGEAANKIKTGDNAFAYGAHWSGVPQTEERSTWSRVLVNFDEKMQGVETGGILAIQMEIICEGELSFLPSIWDGNSASQTDTQSFFNGTATFIPESGAATSYEIVQVAEILEGTTVKENRYLQIAACKGVLLMNLADFEGTTTWGTAISALITVNTINAYDFEIKIGEVGYYTTNTGNEAVAMKKLVTLDDRKDFNKFTVFNTADEGTEDSTAVKLAGTLARIPNKEILPTGRSYSISTAGDIGLIFYIELPNAVEEKVKATFSVVGGVGGSVTGLYRMKDGCFVFAVPVLPKDYDKNVTLTIAHNGVEYSFTRSVQKYTSSLIASQAESNAGKLAAALVEYCEAAKAFFYANGSVGDKEGLTDEENATFAALESYASVKTDQSDAVSIDYGTLSIESKTTIHIYFTSTAALSELNIGVKDSAGDDCTNYTVSKADKENYYVLAINNVSAKDLDETYTVTIGNDTITYSALSYIYSVYKKVADGKVEDDDKISIEHYNLVTELYQYGEAANNYFPKKQ